MMTATAPVHRPLRSVDELVAGATDRTPLQVHDGKSGATLERVTIDGERFVLKHLAIDRDWVARASGDVAPRAVAVWQFGLLDELPATIDHTVVACAVEARAGAVLMRDVGPSLVPDGDTLFTPSQHQQFLDHMADMHVAFWDFTDRLELLPLENRLLLMSPIVSETERLLGGTHEVPTRLIPRGWRRLADTAPSTSVIVGRLLRDPSPLVVALRATPLTFLHGDWKAANLGSDSSGRTILIDWAVPGQAPPCIDLAWYLAINGSRLPESKDAAAARYRESLERRGTETGPWWHQQLGLCLLEAFLLLGWEKALGDREELAWWERRVLDGVQWLR